MNHMSGINRKLNPNEGRQIVDYINKRIEEKAEMERRGIPFFKADTEAFESQDIKRLTILDKVFKTRVTPFKHKRVKEFKITRSHKPFWWELTGFMNMSKSVVKKDQLGNKPAEKKENRRGPLPVNLLSRSPNPSPGPSPESFIAPSFEPSLMTESFEDDGENEDPFSWKHQDIFSDY